MSRQLTATKAKFMVALIWVRFFELMNCWQTRDKCLLSWCAEFMSFKLYYVTPAVFSCLVRICALVAHEKNASSLRQPITRFTTGFFGVVVFSWNKTTPKRDGSHWHKHKFSLV
jgi:hypothetical protein